MRQLSIILFAAIALPLLADQDAGTKFAVAIEKGDAEEVKALLDSGLSTETSIDYGEHKITPLAKAAWDGEAEIVTLLLEKGAKIDARASDTGETALINAVSRGHLEIIKLLLAAHADVAPKNR